MDPNVHFFITFLWVCNLVWCWLLERLWEKPFGARPLFAPIYLRKANLEKCWKTKINNQNKNKFWSQNVHVVTIRLLNKFGCCGKKRNQVLSGQVNIWKVFVPAASSFQNGHQKGQRDFKCSYQSTFACWRSIVWWWRSNSSWLEGLRWRRYPGIQVSQLDVICHMAT